VCLVTESALKVLQCHIEIAYFLLECNILVNKSHHTLLSATIEFDLKLLKLS
jgi:hypothetical protein